jgi:hypothetical protein
MKFTFKREPRATGLMATAYPYQHVQIKLKKKVVGQIIPRRNYGEGGAYLWVVGFRCKVEGPTKWEWKFLKKKFENEDEARAYVNEKFEAIMKWGIYMEANDDE